MRYRAALFLVLLLVLLIPSTFPLFGQSPGMPPDRVLTRSWEEGVHRSLDADRGAVGLWQKLQKLQTTASLMHTTAHPDDEHAGMLTYVSRGLGARTALLTLNRGESGANALGAELFDALGMVRTEELMLSGRYYGLDDQYFTTVLDYGFSKTLDEAITNWGRENVLRDMVRVIRLNRPLVVVSRFHGSERDGHGHHQAAGGITPEAVAAAGDPSRFPEQITDEGLRPWTPLKLYRGGVQADEPWHLSVDASAYSPWLGTTYQEYGLYGLSLQRSQTSGRSWNRPGPAPMYYERLDAAVALPTDRPASATAKEAGFFDGLDTSVGGLFDLTGETPSPEAEAFVQAIEQHVGEAVAAYSMQAPQAVVPGLLRGLEATREALARTGDQPEAHFMLRIKERQFVEAVHAALGLQVEAVGEPAGMEGEPSFWAPPRTLGVVVPGQAFEVALTIVNPSPVDVRVADLGVQAGPGWTIAGGALPEDRLREGRPHTTRFTVRVPDDPVFSRPYFVRESVRESRYQVQDSVHLHRPARTPALAAVVRYEVDGVPIEVVETVRVREADLPYGYVLRELKVAPALAVTVEPEMRVALLGAQTGEGELRVSLLNNRQGPVEGVLRLDVPEGWDVAPPEQAFSFDRPGERAVYTLRITMPGLEARDYVVRAVATAGGRAYSEGYDVIRHRDLDTKYVYRPATTVVRGLDVDVAPGLTVGYVMGVGDDVPSGIEQLGAEVRLLGEADLGTGDLSGFDVIVIGTRAYAVRSDLLTYNQRLLDYARAGGHLVVLYQTQEFVPSEMAPYPAQLPSWAEEISEEDAPVKILAPDHPVFQAPNRITPADFEGWVEQRGSKFFSEWDAAYTALIESNDTGQEPQRGGWLIAPYGDGTYTYFAYAIHRQMPYAVPGPYRIFANLLSLYQTEEP